MRKLTLCVALLLVFTLSTSAAEADTTYDADIDYAALMIEACTTGDMGAGQAAEKSRNEKIDELGLDCQKISFEDLFYLSRQIYIEHGSSWMPDNVQLMTGSVVINRVNSEDWPDTIYDVIYQKGQYAKHEILPDKRTGLNALWLLENGSTLPADVVYQSCEAQGTLVHSTYYDSVIGSTTYFSYG